jgi:protein SCO1/2
MTPRHGSGPARVATLVLVLAAAACGRAEPTREYTVVGQIVAVSPERPEVTIKHEDIKDFMPAMTMPFPVKDRSLLDGRQPGDLVTATLVIGETTVHLSSLEKTGHQPLDVSTVAGLGAREGEPVTDAEFVDENGQPRTLADLRGHRVALTFIYTRCPVPDFCPLMNRHFATVQETLRRRTDLQDVRLLSVTLDPEYDRPPVLKAQAKVYGADPAIWSFLTGETTDLLAFASQFGIYSEADAQSGEIIHSLRTAVIDADGRLVRNIPSNDWTPAELLADLTRTPAPAR